jgi:predicted nucleic acid-binding protein
VTAAVVADASPLIAFQQIGQLQLLHSLFTEIAVPSAVVREIQPSVPPVPWIVERPLTQAIAPLVLRTSLGAGESEALSLALEIRARQLIVDERAARRAAETLGLGVIGRLGILLAAKRAPRLVRATLEAAGEGTGGATAPSTPSGARG